MRLSATILFLALSLGLFAQQRNCGAMEVLEQQLIQNPVLQSRMDAIERHTEEYIRNGGGQERNVITIPVVFHIVHNGQAVGTGENLSEALVLAQLEQLNQDFALTNSDASLIPALFQPLAANTEIQFCLATRTPAGAATTGINRISGGRTSWTRTQIEGSLKPSSIWDRNQYLNVWSVRFGGSDAGLLGYAQFPGGNASTDGTVVVFSSVGSVATPNPGGGNYARGRTLTHEVGHWLNLRHIWGDATCGNDFVADTPVHQTSNGGCPAFPKTNNCSGGPHTEMTMNYMDYTFDACMYMFSAGQKARMRAVLTSGGSRASLNTSPGCTPVGATCNVPTGLGTSGITSSGATLNWGAVSGATAYNVRYRATGTSTWTTVNNGTSTSRTISGLSASTQYEFQVQTVCGGTSSNYSASATFTTGGSGGGCTQNTITVSITLDNYPGETTWQLTNSTGGVVASGGPYPTAGATVVSTSCLPNGCYTFTIFDSYGDGICCGYGNGSYTVTGNGGEVLASGGSFGSSQSTGFCQPNCGTPAGLNATSITTNSATLNWGAVSGASAYNVRARPVGATTWSTGTVTGTSVNFTGLTASTQYEFQVQAVCGGATGSYSASATFTTQSAGCTDNYEPNNSRSSSLPLTPTNQDLSAQIANSTDRDWYRFANLSSARNIRVDLTDLPADYDLELWQNNNRRRRSQNGGTTPEVAIWNTNTVASNWYAHVYGYNGAFSNTQCYTLRISLSSSSFRTDGTTDGIVTDFEVEVPVFVEQSGFTMFPNPVTDQLTLDLVMSADRAVKVSIMDLTGKMMLLNTYDLHKGDSRVTLDVAHLPAGMYLVRVENGELNGVQKLVVARP